MTSVALPALRAVRLQRLAPMLIPAVAFTIGMWVAQPYLVGVFHDDGVYAILAKSLATGQGYRYLHLPGAPVATHYPPGYPLLLSLLWRLSPAFPENVGVLSLANAVFLAVTAWGTWWFARRVLEWPATSAAGAAIVATLSYPLVGLSAYLFSEPFFIAALLPSLVFAERQMERGRRVNDAWILGAVAGAVMLVRTHGAALALAAILVLCLKRRWREAAYVALGSLAVVVPWQVWIAAHDTSLAEPLRGSYGSYGVWLVEGLRNGVGFVGATVTANAREVDALLADRFSLSDQELPRALASFAALMFVVAGALRMYMRAPVTVIFTAIYIAVMLLWPFTPWRFVYAIWPLFILFVGETIDWCLKIRQKALVPGTAALVVAGFLAAGVLRAEFRTYSERSWRSSAMQANNYVVPVLRFVENGTRPNDLVAVEPSEEVYLFTGRRAVPPVRFTAAEYVMPASRADLAASLKQVLATFPVDFVITINPSLYSVAQTLSAESNTARLVPVENFRSGGAFRVERRDSLSTTR